MLDFLNNLVFSLHSPGDLLAVAGIVLAVCAASWRARALSASGAVAALAVGLGVFWCLRFEGLLVLLFFFLSAGILGKLSKKHKETGREKKSGARDASQVFANGFLALFGAICHHFCPGPVFLVVFAAAFAEANSDTWAGEIGRLSSRGPVSIRDFRPVEKGMSGGITALGLAGGFIGSLLVAVLCALLFPGDGAWARASFVCLAGFAGCLLDSVLGASVQVVYVDRATGELTERSAGADGVPYDVSRGVRWIDNDMVNFMSNLFSVVLAMGLTCWI